MPPSIHSDDASSEGLREPLLSPDDTSAVAAASHDKVPTTSIEAFENAAEQGSAALSPERTARTTLSDGNSTTDAKIPALAWSRTTSCWIKLLLPLCILATHVLFYYGQTVDMWRLEAAWHYENVAYTARGKQARILLDALRQPTHYEVTDDHSHTTIRTFTYAYAIQELWAAKGMPGVVLPRIAAAGLVLFSGVWPHLKLVLLSLTWWFSRQRQRRRRILNALAILGKWSLVDVLVVCVMVGVLNLQWDCDDAATVYASVVDHLPELASLVHTLYSSNDVCASALGYSCHKPKKPKHILQCQACTSTVDTFWDHPDSAKAMVKGIDVTGSGHGQLSVAGLSGIYYFCGAVIASILLSLVVDWCDHKSRRCVNDDNNEEDSENEALLSSTTEEVAGQTVAPEVSATLEHALLPDPATSPDDSLEQLVLAEYGQQNLHNRQEHRYKQQRRRRQAGADFRSEADLAFDQRILVDSQQRSNLVWRLLAYTTCILVFVATVVVTMERRIHGALPSLAHDVLGVVWTKQYSLWELGRTTGLAGGWDAMLLFTFCLFVAVGPIVRSLMCVHASRLTEQSHMSMDAMADVRRRQKHMSAWIDFVGAFCAWEVFGCAVFFVGLLMPSITSTIVTDNRCVQLVPDSTSCLEVEFSLQRTVWFVVAGGCSLLLVSQRMRRFSGDDYQ